MKSFGDRLSEAVTRTGNAACVGLDPHLGRLPKDLQASFAGLEGAAYRRAAAGAVTTFNLEVLRRIEGKVPAVKPQLAFYEELGAPGWSALEATCAEARKRGILVVADGKRGDIQSTAKAYAKAILSDSGPLGADALTVNPWLGLDTIDPFLDAVDREGKGLFVLVRTTNAKSAFLQHHGEPRAAHALAMALGQLDQKRVGASGTGPLGAVVGAQVDREEVLALRAAMPSGWFLVPGYGAQGGTRADCVVGARADGLGVLIAASRSVLYPTEAGSWEDIEAAVAAFARDVAV